MNFQEKLKTYANLLAVHGMRIQAGQVVNITCDWMQRDLARLVAENAWKLGAKYVNVDFVDPILIRQRVLYSDDPSLRYVPQFLSTKFNGFVDEHAAILRLIGSEEPDSLSDLDPKKTHAFQAAIRESLKHYYEDGVGRSQIHWTVAAAATPKWGKKVFPHLSEEEAYKALWEAIFHICRADRPDCLEAWKHHNTVLRHRDEWLTKLKIKELHFVGPGTDLKVYLSPKAKFKGGDEQGPFGAKFEPNIPTEECFTTPDRRLTEGRVRVTRPIVLNGQRIDGLHLEFKQGRLANFTATKGGGTFRAYIDNDEGARYLGEVALVGTDSPVYQSGLVFEEILFDENAACHIAVGLAYKFCLEGGTKMNTEELEALGCNKSHMHADLMISDDQVDVHATTYSDEKLTLLAKGRWVH